MQSSASFIRFPHRTHVLFNVTVHRASMFNRRITVSSFVCFVRFTSSWSNSRKYAGLTKLPIQKVCSNMWSELLVLIPSALLCKNKHDKNLGISFVKFNSCLSISWPFSLSGLFVRPIRAGACAYIYAGDRNSFGFIGRLMKCSVD